MGKWQPQLHSHRQTHKQTNTQSDSIRQTHWNSRKARFTKPKHIQLHTSRPMYTETHISTWTPRQPTNPDKHVHHRPMCTQLHSPRQPTSLGAYTRSFNTESQHIHTCPHKYIYIHICIIYIHMHTCAYLYAHTNTSQTHTKKTDLGFSSVLVWKYL